MDFNEWLIESSLSELYKSTVLAFPTTTRRQHATNTIKITHLEWVPWIGMKTLFVKGLAQNEGKEYSPIILFKKVNYLSESVKNAKTLIDNVGKKHIIEQLSFEDQDVLVRCPCKDFFYRFNYYNHIDKSLYGHKRKKYEALYRPGSANPEKSEGLCKHILKLVKALTESGIIK
jgi:hypothetical protein